LTATYRRGGGVGLQTIPSGSSFEGIVVVGVVVGGGVGCVGGDELPPHWMTMATAAAPRKTNK
jgi:hypothetical protein